LKLGMWKVLSDDEIQQIHDNTIEVLGKTGIVIQNELVLKKLEESGAKVDFSRQLARIPEKIVFDALKSVPKKSQVTLYNRECKVSVEYGKGRVHGATGCGANYVLDLETGKRRLGTKKDTENFAKLADALGSIHVVVPQNVPQDVHPGSAALHAAEAVFNNTTKHAMIAAPTGAAAEGVVEIAKVVLGDKKLSDYRILSFIASPTSPLRWEAAATDVLVEVSTNGLMIDLLPECIAGLTAPITLAGYLVVQNAEILAGVVITQLIRRGTPVMYGVACTTMDMKEAWPLIGTPEAATLRIASGQMAKFYDIPYTTNGEADSHCLDEQNCWERLLNDVAAFATDADLIITQGNFGTGMNGSFEQLVIDNEILAFMSRIKRGIDVNSTTIARDLIEKVGPGGQFLREVHTNKYLRSEHLTDVISNRCAFGRWERNGGLDIVQVARRRAKELLAQHKPIPLDKDIASKVRDTVTRYDKIL
jgi:trimethylamine--corrinoid protein Co-methyltransferase